MKNLIKNALILTVVGLLLVVLRYFGLTIELAPKFIYKEFLLIVGCWTLVMFQWFDSKNNSGV